MISAHMPPLPLERKPFGKQTKAPSTQRLPSPKKQKTTANKENYPVATTSKVKKGSPLKASVKQVTYTSPSKPMVVTVPNAEPMDQSMSIVVTPEMREYYLKEERQLRQFIHSQINISNELRKMAETVERQTDQARQRADFLRKTYG